MQKTENPNPLQLKILIIALVAAVCLFVTVFLAAMGLLVWGFVSLLRSVPPQQVQVTEPVATYAPPAPNPYGPEDFEEVDGYMACLSGPYSLGVDVSEYQGSINWQKVKDAGIEFVFIRVGGRGWGTGKLYADSKAQEYYEGAKAAGLQVGVYFFSQAISLKEAFEEAWYTLYLIDGWELDLPVVFDWEYVNGGARTANMKARMLTDCSLAFCKVIQKAGLEAMIYFNPSQGRDLLYLEELTEFPFWLAMYDAPMNYEYEIEYWQYTKNGSVPGMTGNADINICILP